jgi:hypothetical protein
MLSSRNFNSKGVEAFLVSEVAKNKKTRRAASMLAFKKVESEKAILTQNILAHPASIEISTNPSTSEFLLGADGSLFSFIGFPAGSDPVSELLSVANSSVFLKSTSPRIRKKEGIVQFLFQVRVPSVQDLSASPNLKLPFESGLSWVDGIERGISGLGNYMYKASGFRTSRSGQGLQSKLKVRSGKFKNTPYMTEILQKFMLSISKG